MKVVRSGLGNCFRLSARIIEADVIAFIWGYVSWFRNVNV